MSERFYFEFQRQQMLTDCVSRYQKYLDSLTTEEVEAEQYAWLLDDPTVDERAKELVRWEMALLGHSPE